MSQSAVILKRSLLLTGGNASVAALKQMLLIAALIGGTWLLAEVHRASVARPVFVAGATAIAIFYIRHSPWQYLTAVLWIWTISPFVRRVVDYYGGFQDANIVLLTPYVVTLFMLKSILTSRELPRRPEAGTGMLLLGPTFYGLGVSLVKGAIFAGALSALDWLIPLLFYFYLIALTPRIDEAEAHFRAFIPLNMLVVIGYGLYQYYYPPPWDLRWVAEIRAFILPAGGGHVQLKLFSVLSGPGICAIWVGALILLSMHFRTWLSVLVLPPAILFLGLTQVRLTAGAVVLGLAVAAFFGEGRVRRSVGGVIAAMVAAAAAIAILDPTTSDGVISRFATVYDLQNDGSALAREELYRTSPALIDDYPLGQGIGALGKGAGIGASANAVGMDSGVLAPFVAFGWIAGMIYILGFFTVAGQACLAAKSSRSPAVLALAIVAVTCLAESLFTMMIGLQGIVIWFSAGYASAIAMRTRDVKSARRQVADLSPRRPNLLNAGNNALVKR
jgi:hypothetical protein